MILEFEPAKGGEQTNFSNEEFEGQKIINLTREDFRELQIKKQVNKFLEDNSISSEYLIDLKTLLRELDIRVKCGKLFENNICVVQFSEEGNFIFLNRDYSYENKCSIIYFALAVFIEDRKDSEASFYCIEDSPKDFYLSFDKQEMIDCKLSQSFAYKASRELKGRDLFTTNKKDKFLET